MAAIDDVRARLAQVYAGHGVTYAEHHVPAELFVCAVAYDYQVNTAWRAGTPWTARARPGHRQPR